DCAIATFAVCDSERVVPVALIRQQNVSPRHGRCRRDSFHRQERTCFGTRMVPPSAEPVLFRSQPKFAQQFVAPRADVPLSPPQRESKPRQQRGQSLTTTNCKAIALALQAKRLPGNFRELPLPARKVLATAALVAAFSVRFQARKNRSLRLQSYLQVTQGIPVPRCCCIL